MRETILFWILAFLITILIAFYQRFTGPTYPLSGSVQFEGEEIHYKFLRSHSTSENYLLEIETNNPKIKGILFWKRYKFDKEFNRVEMTGDGVLKAELPIQPPAGKLQYFVRLYSGINNINVPENYEVIIRFKDDVPDWIMIPHIFAMFFSMLFAARAGLELFAKQPNFKFYTYWTVGILFVGGFIFGPIMQKFAFGEYWTGFPFGYDLTDNKTLIALIGWLIALFMIKKSPNPKRWVMFAALVMLIVYLIPHSVLGSEHDYNKSQLEHIQQ